MVMVIVDDHAWARSEERNDMARGIWLGLRNLVLRNLFHGSIALALLLSIAGLAPNHAHAADKVRFAVGPFQPTPGDTKKAYEPFFGHLAKPMGVDYELVATTNCA